MLLLIDSYDSFTYNLKALVERATNRHVVVVHNDQLTKDELLQYLPLFEAVIIGPGPGNPSNSEDVGVIPLLFDQRIPLLGICLGFQSLCLSQGCEVKRLEDVKHGQVYNVHHDEDPLFHGIENEFPSVRYHSLFVPELTDSLVKLAHTVEANGDEVLMAVKHATHPWYGVQYHPESICSKFGFNLIVNFMTLADTFNKKRSLVKDDALLCKLISSIKVEPLISSKRRSFKLHQKSINSKRSALEICDSLQQQSHEFILLNSASSPGEWSIIALPSRSSLRISHSTENNNTVFLNQNGKQWTEQIISIWTYISSFMSDKLIVSSSHFPFIGGLIGIFSYEEGHHLQLGKLPKMTTSNIPDTNLVFVEECILLNNTTGETFITSLNSISQLEEIESLLEYESTPITFIDSIHAHYINKPDEALYKDLFNQCQSFLHSGDSYELCLTTSTEIGISSTLHPWEIYKLLTLRNPSPYSAYFNFDDCILLSSSPERFISWDNSKCELRPIKGTVKKTDTMTFARASEILNTPKELGENLMIVDLIRHDLYQLLDEVRVSKLMSVEEYKTVYQLVSVISGIFKSEYSGIDILSKSLPPGSMTGAPKRRSVEILQQLENSRRGLYSGVCGYWSLENRADWSVIIRSIFHYKGDLKNTDSINHWRIGAGGAITVLSDPDGEWEEMLTKLDSALSVFT
jgi:para-aminobenzoate synthetase